MTMVMIMMLPGNDFSKLILNPDVKIIMDESGLKLNKSSCMVQQVYNIIHISQVDMM